jgi:CheY-like chemotaxis protein
MSRILALVDDLMLLSRVREAARGAGAEVRPVRQPAQLLEGVREGGGLVVVDADSSRLPWSDALATLRREKLLDTVPVVAFFSHVHPEQAEKARAAGCDRVLARSAFVKALPDLIAGSAEPLPSLEDLTP